jgi:amidase
MEKKTILDLQASLNNQSLTSVELVEYYLNRIKLYEPKLNAIADLNHTALVEAEILDQERIQKGPRSLLHGIPILIKDNILTKDHLRTTANALVFKDFYAPYEGLMIKKLREAGAIILGKANCSEFAYFVSFGNMPSGYGSLHKQVKHPYNTAIDPLGSSTGSAVGVAADYAPVSIGTETNGSLTSPAQANSVVTIKPTVGLVSRHGIIPITVMQDTAGPMSKNVTDAAIVLDIIKGMDSNDLFTKRIPEQETNYLKACTKGIKGLKVGILEFNNYKNDEEENKILEQAQHIFEAAGATCKPIDFAYKLPSNLDSMKYEFKRDFNVFLSTIRSHSPIQTLNDLVRYNLEKPSLRLRYGQRIFHASEATSATLKEPEYLTSRQNQMKEINTFIDLYDTHDVDVIVMTKISGYPAVGGIPVLSVPAKPLKDERPINLLFIGKAFKEETLFSIGYIYEKQTKHRIPPKL